MGATGGEKTVVSLIGGPLDGVLIDVDRGPGGDQWPQEIWPLPHHLKACDCPRRVRYERREGKYRFDGVSRELIE